MSLSGSRVKLDSFLVFCKHRGSMLLWHVEVDFQEIFAATSLTRNKSVKLSSRALMEQLLRRFQKNFEIKDFTAEVTFSRLLNVSFDLFHSGGIIPGSFPRHPCRDVLL